MYLSCAAGAIPPRMTRDTAPIEIVEKAGLGMAWSLDADCKCGRQVTSKLDSDAPLVKSNCRAETAVRVTDVVRSSNAMMHGSRCMMLRKVVEPMEFGFLAITPTTARSFSGMPAGSGTVATDCATTGPWAFPTRPASLSVGVRSAPGVGAADHLAAASPLPGFGGAGWQSKDRPSRKPCHVVSSLI